MYKIRDDSSPSETVNNGQWHVFWYHEICVSKMLFAFGLGLIYNCKNKKSSAQNPSWKRFFWDWRQIISVISEFIIPLKFCLQWLSAFGLGLIYGYEIMKNLYKFQAKCDSSEKDNRWSEWRKKFCYWQNFTMEIICSYHIAYLYTWTAFYYHQKGLSVVGSRLYITNLAQLKNLAITDS